LLDNFGHAFAELEKASVRVQADGSADRLAAIRQVRQFVDDAGRIFKPEDLSPLNDLANTITGHIEEGSSQRIIDAVHLIDILEDRLTAEFMDVISDCMCPR